MNDTTEIESGGALDSIKLILAIGLVVGGLYAYYALPDLALPLRVLCVLVGVIAGCGVALTTYKGRTFAKFVQGSRVEIRKVVWPTRQETLQVTLAVFLFTALLGVFFWGLDSLLLWLTRILTGQI
ncbi:MAG: preprotein translocase subunit SecE [Pseudomonadota bacterium]